MTLTLMGALFCGAARFMRRLYKKQSSATIAIAGEKNV
jgi:hypothetical protein